MNFLTYNRLPGKRTKYAKLFIALACLSCSLLPLSSAIAEENYWQGFIDLQNELVRIQWGNSDIVTEVEELKQALLAQQNLVSNPWWATNSAFTLTKAQYNLAYPNEYPNNGNSFSFPQFLSQWSSFLTYPQTTGNPSSYSNLKANWQNYFGSGRFSSRSYPNSANPYTWFDWVSDFMRSNMIATSAISTNELGQWAAQSGADYVEEFSSETNQLAIAQSITNGLDEIVSATDDITTGVESTANTLFSSFHFDSLLPSSYTGGDPTLTIFPESTIGGVHVNAVVGSLLLPNDVVYWVNLVARFLWSVIFLSCFFSLAKNEYTYWVSLGHTEGNAA